MADSLSEFFSKTPDATLNDCDREQVHVSGAIQDAGALLAVDRETWEIVAATESAAEVLGTGEASFVGQALGEIAPNLRELLEAISPEESGFHAVLDGEFSKSEIPMDGVAHVSGGCWVIEFVPSLEMSPRKLRTHVRTVGRDAVRILNASSPDEALSILCESIRELLGFGRVNVYKFLSDWSGKVVAEATDGSMPEFLGLHFPASDIPKQARALYAITPFRAVSGVHDAVQPILQSSQLGASPLDLSRSILRSVSPMHTAYLRNMGVESSFSLGLEYEGKLWGLIACHATAPGLPSFDAWTLARELGNALMAHVKKQDIRDAAEKVMELREIERMLASAVHTQASLTDLLARAGPDLLELLEADGFAFKHGGVIQCAGKTPPVDFIHSLIGWLPQNIEEDGQFRSTALHLDWEPAKDHLDTACGVLVQPVRPNRNYYMIWFRAPHSEVVNWAGEPTDKFKPALPGTTGTLEPRHSFEAWRSQHSDRCREWTSLDERVASDSLREILTVIAEMLALGEENSNLRTFAAAAAHDIKGPLRGIEFALSVMAEESFDPATVEQFHEIAERSTNRLGDLTTSLLNLMSVDRESLPRESIDLTGVIAEIEQLLMVEIRSSGVSIVHGSLPNVFGDPTLVLSLFLNLVSNSMKFARPGVPPRIEFSGSEVLPDFIRISVKDNGIGISPANRASIFKPFVRLHRKDEIEGSGLGLAICSRIVELHGGQIRAIGNVEEGTEIEVLFPVAGPAL